MTTRTGSTTSSSASPSPSSSSSSSTHSLPSTRPSSIDSREDSDPQSATRPTSKSNPRTQSSHTHTPHRHTHNHSHAHHSDLDIQAELRLVKERKVDIWWSNGIFFVSLHLMALLGVIHFSPPSQLQWKTAVLCFVSWQLASFGVTLGYHRLWSHRAYTATMPLRIVLAWMASMGFQGSARWWVLRHRLHHRFTDSPLHDPYAATRGLFYAHMGWVLQKPKYARIGLIEREDLDADPVVRFQHKYYIWIALFSGLVLPTLIAKFGWGDAMGGYVWGGLVARLLIWHTTFCINSLAHWTGLQPYTEEVTAKGNYLLALLTSGEGNHNFHHAFPRDYRNGPHPADWDPTKWFISFLHHYTPFVPTIAITPESDILKARSHVHHLHAERLTAQIPSEELPVHENDLPVWSKREVVEQVNRGDRLLVLIDGFMVDVTRYQEDHPGGPALLKTWSIKAPAGFAASGKSSAATTETSSPHDSGYGSASGTDSIDGAVNQLEERELAFDNYELKDASKAFFGQINNHSFAAKEKMRFLRVARLESAPDVD